MKSVAVFNSVNSSLGQSHQVYGQKSYQDKRLRHKMDFLDIDGRLKEIC